MAWWEVNLTFLELVLLSVGGQGETEPMLAISTHTDTLKLLCLLWKKMNNHWLVWFISAYSWIHRTLRIKMPLEIVQSQPQLKAGSGWEGYRGRFLSHRETWSCAWPLFQWKCCFLNLNAISCASVGASGLSILATTQQSWDVLLPVQEF